MDELQWAWIRERALNFGSLEPDTPQACGERATLNRIIAAASVVGIGEAVHGSSTVIQSSVRVLKFLIEDRQADVIILGACPGATHILDRHLVRGEEEAEDALVAIGGWNYAN